MNYVGVERLCPRTGTLRRFPPGTRRLCGFTGTTFLPPLVFAIVPSPPCFDVSCSCMFLLINTDMGGFLANYGKNGNKIEVVSIYIYPALQRSRGYGILHKARSFMRVDEAGYWDEGNNFG